MRKTPASGNEEGRKEEDARLLHSSPLWGSHFQCCGPQKHLERWGVLATISVACFPGRIEGKLPMSREFSCSAWPGAGELTWRQETQRERSTSASPFPTQEIRKFLHSRLRKYGAAHLPFCHGVTHI